MQEQENFVHYYLDRLDENAFMSLVEAGDDILPMLEQQYRREASPGRRAFIIKVIRQQRNRQSLEILGHALADPEECVWQQALDGLLALGGEEAKDLMRSALATANPYQAEYIAEALELIDDSNYF